MLPIKRRIITFSIHIPISVKLDFIWKINSSSFLKQQQINSIQKHYHYGWKNGGGRTGGYLTLSSPCLLQTFLAAFLPREENILVSFLITREKYLGNGRRLGTTLNMLLNPWKSLSVITALPLGIILFQFCKPDKASLVQFILKAANLKDLGSMPNVPKSQPSNVS